MIRKAISTSFRRYVRCPARFFCGANIGNSVSQYLSTCACTGKTSTVYKNAPAGLFFPGDAGFPRSLWNRHLANFGPRVGLAFNPHGDGRDSFRVSAAILFDNGEVFFDERKTTNPPYGGSVTLTAPPIGR